MMTVPDPDTLAAALTAHDAGLCVVRVSTDGLKKPLGKWKQYQTERPARELIEQWFAGGHPGLGVICGAVSGNLEMLELEGRFMHEIGSDAFKAAIADAGLDLVFQRLARGYQVASPSGGFHFIYRVDGPIDGNTKLARRPATDEELAENADDTIKTLIETRGEGGFVVLAPSHGPVHPTGRPWTFRKGSFAEIPTITSDERERLFEVCRSFEVPIPRVEPIALPPARVTRHRPHVGHVGESWFDAVVAHLEGVTSVRNELERHGWTFCYTDGHGRHLLRRPGKDQGTSGSINAIGRFHPFSTSVPFEVGGRPAPTYDVLDVVAAYEYGGDRTLAARTIAEHTGILERWKAERPAMTPRDVDPETGEVTSTPFNLPNEFWEARPVLRHIRQAAHCRGRCADAVLLFTLARVAAVTPPTVVLPAIVGGRASLNFLGGIVSSSGGGKTTAGDVARDLLPIDRVDVMADVPPGSGEGLTELFFEFVTEEDADGKKRKVKRQTKTGALIYLDEGEALAEMGSRKGATLMPTLRSAWSGAVIGQSNATQETHRVLAAHKYRLAIMVGFQVEFAAEMIADATGGTPQRFVFARATDPAIPDDAPEWPGELEIGVPPMVSSGTEMAFDEQVAADIGRRARMAARGEFVPDPLDTHRDLVKMKVAALLARLEDRLYVTAEDWELAGDVMKVSTAIRSWAIEVARQHAEQSEQSYAVKLARRALVVEDSAESRALVSGAKSIARRIHKVGEPIAYRDARAAVASKHRDIVSVEDMLAHAVDCKWVSSSSVDPENRQDDGRRWGPGEAVPV